jgi:hypothetical protein
MRSRFNIESKDAIVLAHWDNLVIVGDEDGTLDRSRGFSGAYWRNPGGDARYYVEEIERQHRFCIQIVQDMPYDQDGNPQTTLKYSVVPKGASRMNVMRPIRFALGYKGEHPYDLDDRVEYLDFKTFSIKDTYGSGKALQISVAYDPWNRIWYRSGDVRHIAFIEGIWLDVDPLVAQLDPEPRRPVDGPQDAVPDGEADGADRESRAASPEGEGAADVRGRDEGGES